MEKLATFLCLLAAATAASRDPEFFYGPLAPLDFLKTFNDMFEQMRQQMATMLAMTPGRGADTPAAANSSSVTKVIDGHKYVVNETVYSGGDGDAGAVFRVRVLDIRPADHTSTPEAPSDSHENDVGRTEPVQKALGRADHVSSNELGPWRSLAGDTRVNWRAAARGWTPHPDAEWLESDSELYDLDNRLLPEPAGAWYHYDTEPMDR